MSILKSALFTLILALQLQPTTKQLSTLIGVWQGKYEEFEIGYSGKVKPRKLKKIPTISLVFKSDHTGYIAYDDSIETTPSYVLNFSYNILNNQILSINSKGHRSYYIAKRTNPNILNLSTYPAPKGPQEDVEILTLVEFFRRSAQ
jgi:hypothetical protein